MSLTATTTIEQVSPHLLIRFIAPPESLTAAPPVDFILDYLRTMLEEGLVPEGDLREAIRYYQTLAFEDGFGKAWLLCRVISRIINVQIKLEKDEINLSLLLKFRFDLKELLEDLLIEDVDVDAFIRQYDNCFVRMEVDRLGLERFNNDNEKSSQQLDDYEQKTGRAIKASYAPIGPLIQQIAQRQMQKAGAQHHAMQDLAKSTTEACQETTNNAEALVQLDNRLSQINIKRVHVNQDLRSLMEKVQKK